MELTQERIVEELVAIGFARATDILDVKDGQTLLKEAADGTAIANLETTPKGVKVKFYDKLKALELLGKYLGLFEAQPQQTGQKSTLLQEIVASTKEVIDTHDLPEIQQATAAGHDLVEQTQPTAP